MKTAGLSIVFAAALLSAGWFVTTKHSAEPPAAFPSYQQLSRQPQVWLPQLKHFAEDAQNPTREGEAEFLQGYYYFTQGDYEKSYEHFSKPSVTYTALTSHAVFFQAELLFFNRQYQEALLRYETLTDSPLFGTRVKSRMAEAGLERGDVSEAQRLFECLPEAERPWGFYRVIDFYEQGGCQNQAIPVLGLLLSEHADSMYARLLEDRIGDEGYGQGMSDDFWRLRAKTLFDSRDYSRSLKALDHIGEADPEDRLLEGRGWFRKGFKTRALSSWKGLSGAHVEYARALCYRRRNLGLYRSHLDKAIGTREFNTWWGQAAFDRYRDLEKQGAVSKARSVLDDITTYARESGHRNKALWMRAWKAYLEGKTGLSQVDIETLVKAPGMSREEEIRALYWKARWHLEGAERSEAESVYAILLNEFPFHYYTVKLQNRLDEAFDRKAAFTDANPEYEPLYSAMEPEWSAMASLASLGLLELVSEDLEHLGKRYPDHPLVSALQGLVAGKQGEIRYALISLIRAHRKDRQSGAPRLLAFLPEKALRIFYPKGHWDAIEHYARKRKLDPLLVAAIIQQESTFDSRARSRSGARGLMQIMPSTGKTIARQKKVSFNLQRLYDSETNLDFGTYYFANLLDKFGGREELALAAYNGGPTRVTRWWKKTPDEDVDIFVESIPLTETRLYVKKVLSHYSMYRHLESQRLSQSLDGDNPDAEHPPRLAVEEFISSLLASETQPPVENQKTL